MDCIFCRIAGGEIPSDFAYQDDEIVAFKDIKPIAPVHLIVIPRRHIESLAGAADEDTALMGRLVSVANRLAREAGVSASGYRLVANCGPDGGQEVPHVHLHVIGGRKLGALG
jgi:histidine triad (HIT) family protein